MEEGGIGCDEPKMDHMTISILQYTLRIIMYDSENKTTIALF